MIGRLITIIIPAIYCSGCSPGLIGVRTFSNDSHYLVWQDVHYLPGINFEVKLTDCADGRTVVLGNGNFVLDRTGDYLVLYPASDRPGAYALVRLCDGQKRAIPTPPNRKNFYMPNWQDVSVTQFDPPQLTALLVSKVNHNFVRYQIGDGNWVALEEGDATRDQLADIEAHCKQLSFNGQQIEELEKRTLSPNGRFVLVESMRGPIRSSRLISDERTFLLSLQTDQVPDGLRKLTEVIFFCGK